MLPLPAIFNPLCSSTNQQLFKKNFCNQSSHYENYRRFNESHHVPTTKSTLFVVNKEEWYINEGCATCKSEKVIVFQKSCHKYCALCPHKILFTNTLTAQIKGNHRVTISHITSTTAQYHDILPKLGRYKHWIGLLEWTTGLIYFWFLHTLWLIKLIFTG